MIISRFSGPGETVTGIAGTLVAAATVLSAAASLPLVAAAGGGALGRYLVFETGAILIVTIASVTLLGRSARRLHGVEIALLRAAGGDMTTVLGVSGSDQLARIANSVDASLASVRKALHEVAAVNVGVRREWHEIGEIGASLSSSAETTVNDTLAVQAAAAGVSANMHVVASANEELATTVGEIASAAAAAASIARAAVEHASEADVTSKALQDEANQLGDISTLINALARQTRLLALNARIEASRENTDQQGFVVVAGEVKMLANDTAKATGRVGDRVSQIRTCSAGVNDVMQVLLSDLGEVTKSQTAIASSVQQQLAATHEISRVSAVSAAGSRDITESIMRISHVMRRIAYGGSQSRNAASELAGLYERLSALGSKFEIGEGVVEKEINRVRSAVRERDGVTVIKNDVIGTGINELDYNGDWCHSDANEVSGDSDAYGSMPGDTVTLRFVGTRATFFGVTDGHHGMAAISVDGGPEEELDEYSAERRIGAKLWESGQLTSGTHTLTLRILERKNPASRYYWVTVDRIEIR